MTAFPSEHVTDVPLRSLVIEFALREELLGSPFTSVTDDVNLPPGPQVCVKRTIPAVGTAVFNSSRVDSPDGKSSSVHYTSVSDIISRTYPTRWSSELT